MIDDIIASGSSERGLSEVTITTSAKETAISPIIGRFILSRSPPHPKTKITLDSGDDARTERKTSASPSGVWAKSTRTTKSCPPSTCSKRPGTAGADSSPFTMSSIVTPISRAVVAAAREFITLTFPPIPTRIVRPLHEY